MLLECTIIEGCTPPFYPKHRQSRTDCQFSRVLMEPSKCLCKDPHWPFRELSLPFLRPCPLIASLDEEAITAALECLKPCTQSRRSGYEKLVVVIL